MASIMDGVNRLTQLAGHNRMELLMFHLGDKQKYGINVFKVQEVIHCPKLTHLPNASSIVCGVANIRGKTMSVVDLSMAIGKTPLPGTEGAFIIVAEYNRQVQGFLVSGVDRIINMNWEDILPPPRGLGSGCYLTAVTEYEDEFIEIIDVERVLAELNPTNQELPDDLAEDGKCLDLKDKFVLVADDSSVARNQIKRPLDELGIRSVMAKNGREALDMLKDWAENDPEMLTKLAIIVSDIEMPEMDGYTLTTEIRKDPRLARLFIVLHTSLTGGFNKAMTEKVGANDFLSKYDPDLLSGVILNRLRKLEVGRDVVV